MKNIKIIQIVIFLFFANILAAQEYVFTSTKVSGGEFSDIVSARCIDSKGMHLQCGSFYNETIKEGKKIISNGKSDIFLAKYNENGEPIWQKNFGGTESEYVESIICDAEENIYLAGNFEGTLEIDGETISATDFCDNFLAKFTKEGKLEFLKHIDANTKASPLLLAVGSEGQLFLAGSFYGSLAIDGIKKQSESSADIFVAQFDTEGEFSEIFTAGGFDKQQLNSIACDSNNNLYLAGEFLRKINMGEREELSEGEEDVFIACINNMQIVWMITGGSKYRDYARQIKTYNDKIFVTGNFTHEITFDDKTLISNGVLDAFVAVFNTEGVLQWANSFGGGANDYVSSIAINNMGDCYISGVFRGEIQTDKETIKSKDFKNDVYLAKFNQQGEYVRAMSFGSPAHDASIEIVTDNQLYIHHSGQFSEVISFTDSKKETGNSEDIFDAKYYDCDYAPSIKLGEDIELCGKEILIEADKQFSTYQWQNGERTADILIKASGLYILTCTDEHGCKSSDTIEVILHKVPEIIIEAKQTICRGEWAELHASEGFTEYLWNTGANTPFIMVNSEGTYNLTATDINGCEAIAETFVKFHHSPQPNLGEDFTVVKGEKIILTVGDNFATYNWNNLSGESTLIIETETMESGDYYYQLTVTDINGCTSETDLWVSVVETAQHTEQTDNKAMMLELKAQIYPNPNNGSFTYTIGNLNAMEDLLIRMMTPEGKIVWENSPELTGMLYQNNIHLENLAAGTYYFQIINGSQTITEKVIVK